LLEGSSQHPDRRGFRAGRDAGVQQPRHEGVKRDPGTTRGRRVQVLSYRRAEEGQVCPDAGLWMGALACCCR
jgi:hypothetical protein